MISVECEKMEAKSVAGEDINLDLFGTLTDRLGRTLQRLGLRRVPKVIGPPDLQEYLRDRQVIPRGAILPATVTATT
jgi:hypothetical protein